MDTSVTTVTVTLEDREDGGVRVFSAKLPGLMLSGKTREKMSDRIGEAIRVLMEHKGFHVVTVRPETPIEDVLKRKSPREVDVHVLHVNKHKARFVVELVSAA